MHDNDGRLTHDCNMTAIYGIHCSLNNVPNSIEKSLMKSWQSFSYTRHSPTFMGNPHTVVCTVIRTRCGVRIPVCARNFPLLQNAQTSSGAHPESYSVGTGVSPGVIVAEARCLLLISIYSQGWEWVVLYLCSPYMSSWRIPGADLPLPLPQFITASTKTHFFRPYAWDT